MTKRACSQNEISSVWAEGCGSAAGVVLLNARHLNFQGQSMRHRVEEKQKQILEFIRKFLTQADVRRGSAEVSCKSPLNSTGKSSFTDLRAKTLSSQSSRNL